MLTIFLKLELNPVTELSLFYQSSSGNEGKFTNVKKQLLTIKPKGNHLLSNSFILDDYDILL